MDNSDSAGKEGRPRVDHPTRIPDVFPFGYNGIRFRQSSSNSNVRGASELAGLGWSWRVFNPPLENPDNEFRLEAAHDLHIAPNWAAAGNQAARIGTSGYQSAANYYAPAPSGPLIGRPGYHTAGSYNSHLYNLPAAVVGGVGNHEQNMNPSGGMNEEVDSHGKFKIEEVPHDNREKYKTELCYHWERHGHCPYGDHCIFAHGEQELRPVTRHANYKTKLCYNVLARGSCRFGRRCHFRHALSHNI